MIAALELTLTHPERLWLLLPAGLIGLLWYRRRRAPSPWTGIVEARLLNHLNGLSDAGPQRRWLAPLLLALGLLLAVVALTEPRLPGAGERLYQRSSAVLLVLDLSSPEAPPPKLTRALNQWLETTRVPQVGLLAMAGSAHEVVPPTPDTAMVRRQLQWLSHDSMPVKGRDLAGALETARAIIDRTSLTNAAVVVLGTGETVTDAVNENSALAADGIPVHHVTLNDAGESPASGPTGAGGQWWTADEFPDQSLPLPRGRDAFSDYTQAGEGPDPRHPGPWLALALALLATLGLRRGWLLVLALLIVPPPLPAQDWDEQVRLPLPHDALWRTPDQLAMAYYRDGEYARAAEHFRDPEWRGMAFQRAGQHLQAAGAFALVDSARAHYNRGNALVHANRMGEAISAYETALERDPDHPRAEHNRDRVNDYLDARRAVVQQQQDEASEGRATHHPGPLLQDDPAEFWRRKFELDLRRRGQDP